MPPSKLIGVGAFVLFGLLLFAIGLFMIGDRRLLFREHVQLFTEFANIAGLQTGAKVRVAGMDAGEVLEIAVPRGPGYNFRVRMRVRSDLHPVIRTDSIATIQTDGLVGAKFVQIQAGSEAAPVAEPGSAIPGHEPFDLADLMEQMRGTVALVNASILEIRDDVERTIATIGQTADNANVLIGEVGEQVMEITAHGRRIAVATDDIIDGVRAGRGTLGQLITDERLYDEIAGIAEAARDAVEQARLAAEQARRVVTDLEADDSPMHGLAGDLRLSLQHARDAMANLAENTEALKRNWLFRGFFERRGYYDLDRLSVGDYLDGALENRGRRGLRIWLGADVLFESGPRGEERLSGGGRARLDSSMAEFLRYPLTSPLVIEGYATGVTRDERFLRSRQRAVLVRQYLVERFQMSPSRVGIMPIGEEAIDSPAGDRWSGVALALFADPAARR